MTRIMRKNGDAETHALPLHPTKPPSYEIGEDEAGMRLDRWLHRRFPEVCELASDADRAQGRGARLAASGRTFRPGSRQAKACACRRSRSPRSKRRPLKRADPGDLEAIRAMTLFEDRDVLVLNKPYRPRGPGRLGDQAPYRRHAAGARRQGGQQRPFSFIGWIATRRACC